MEKLKNLAKENIRTTLNWIDLINGMRSFKATGKTPNKAYQAMIRLHGRTHGLSTDWIAKRYATLAQEAAITPCTGILGHLTVQDITRINQQIREKGYYVFEEVIPADICDQITEFALKKPALIESDDMKGHQEEFAIFSATNPISKTYKLPESTSITHPLVQDLMADDSLRAIARAYVCSEPVLASVNIWFSPAYQPAVISEAAAQSYHFDMSRCRWLNFFIYLNDVDIQNGPHCFIKSSHKPNKKAKPLLKRGYVRIPDEDIYSTFGKENEIEFSAKKGSIIVEDTIGFHKGKIPTKGYRSMLEFVYAVNLFGGAYHNYTIPNPLTEKLKKAIKENHVSYQRYQIKD